MKKQCKVFDSCRACSFKELQQVEACQETGFRLILHCKTTLKDNKHEVLTESYDDKSCQEAPTDLTPLRDGELAVHKSGPFSMYWLLVIFSTIAYGLWQVLMQRRANILNQVYSSLSIVKTKN